MSSALAPYGPQSQFQKTTSNSSFGGNLSGFLPEDSFDHQPVELRDAACILIADVRLDNRDELVRRLGLTQPETLADSSVLAAAWNRWGPACVSYLVGVFAFAVWNPRNKQLFVARDHTGERPLFYHRGDDFFAFASMPKGLLAIPGVDQGVDEETLTRSLTLAAYSQAVSFFKGIERLPPGHSLEATPAGVRLNAFWKPFEAAAPRFRRDEDYVEAFLEIFDAAVAARLRSTGGIAAQLSAGLDSSSVAASAASLLAPQGRRLTALTAVPRPGFQGKGFPGRLPDEGPGASDVAALYPNIDHILLDSAGQDLVRVVQDLSDAADEPIQNSVNSLWLAATLDDARARGCNVMLVGIRGNLTLSHTGLEALGDMFRRLHWLKLARTAHAMRKNGFVSYRRSAARAFAGLLPTVLHHRLHNVSSFDLTYSAVNPAIAAQRDLRDAMLNEFIPNTHDLQHERRHLFQTYDLDTYAAGYQAVHGVDVRDPCADRRVLDFCFGLPVEQYVVGGVPRSLVRRAMKSRLPASTLTRTIRGQQGADWYLVMQEAMPHLRPEMLRNEQSPTARRLLDLPRMRTLLDTWPTGPLEEEKTSHAWGDALSRGFSFGYFIRKHEKPQA